MSTGKPLKPATDGGFSRFREGCRENTLTWHARIIGASDTCPVWLLTAQPISLRTNCRFRVRSASTDCEGESVSCVRRSAAIRSGSLSPARPASSSAKIAVPPRRHREHRIASGLDIHHPAILLQILQQHTHIVRRRIPAASSVWDPEQ